MRHAAARRSRAWRLTRPASVIPSSGSWIRKLDHALDNPEISRIFTREVLDGGHNLHRFWPNAHEWTREKIETIESWIERGAMRRLDARLLLVHIWSMTQSYADYALQTRLILGMQADAPFDREPIARELISLVLLGCGIPVPDQGETYPGRLPR